MAFLFTGDANKFDFDVVELFDDSEELEAVEFVVVLEVEDEPVVGELSFFRPAPGASSGGLMFTPGKISGIMCQALIAPLLYACFHYILCD